jgi:hypothetical protein
VAEPVETNASRPLSRSHLFAVRVWREDLGDDCFEWRGQVRHMLSGETHYFRDWQSLTAFFVESAVEADAAAGD